MSPETTPSAPRRRRTLRGLLLRLALACVATALALELGVVLVLGPQVRFPRNVVDGGMGLRVNRPHAVYAQRSADVEVTFRINSRGLRADREFPYEKPAGVVRVVAIGDSFTAGYEVELEQCFTSVLERELRAAGHAVEVLNAGVSGYSNAEACLYLERELLRYDPDVVLLSFFFNDLVDNVRAGLYALEEGELRQVADGYVPLGELGNRLNSNPVFGWLSERSNAFALLKEKATLAIKGRIVRENLDNVDGADEGALDDYQSRLAAAILERVFATCRARGIHLVVQSIPLFVATPGGEQLVDAFPHEHFDVERVGLSFVAMRPLLEGRFGEDPLYHRRSHFHWTPFSNELSGRALAAALLASGALDARERPVGARADGE